MNDEELSILSNMIYFINPNFVIEKSLFEFLDKVSIIEGENEKKELEKELEKRKYIEETYREDTDTNKIFSQLVNEHLIKYTKFSEVEVGIYSETNKDNLYLYKDYEMFHNKLVNILSDLYEKNR